MNEIYARKKLIHQLNDEVKDIESKIKKEVFENREPLKIDSQS